MTRTHNLGNRMVHLDTVEFLYSNMYVGIVPVILDEKIISRMSRRKRH